MRLCPFSNFMLITAFGKNEKIFADLVSESSKQQLSINWNGHLKPLYVTQEFKRESRIRMEAGYEYRKWSQSEFES